MGIFRASAFVFFLVMGCSAYSFSQSDSITFYLLRGIGRESGHWGTKVPGAIQANIPNARFVMMDLPGAGQYHDQSALPTVEKMADFLRDQYAPHRDSLSQKRVIVATSLAGNVALEWVNTYPTDFHGAVLISSSFKGVCKGKERVRKEAKKDFVDIFLTKDIAEREKAFLDINSNLNTNNDSLLHAWVELQQQHPVAKGALLKQIMAGMIYSPELESPAAELLIVGSASDKIVATSCLQSVATTLDSELYLHPTAGHGLPIDAPKWLADTVSYWTLSHVLPFQFDEALKETPVETRTDSNGLLPVAWDDGTDFVKNTSKITWSSMKSSWKWAEQGVTKSFKRAAHKEKNAPTGGEAESNPNVEAQSG